MAVTPDGHHAITGADDRTVRVWDLHTGELARFTGDGGYVLGLAVTADDVIVAGTASGAVYFLDFVR